jgi:hypothetical protein
VPDIVAATRLTGSDLANFEYIRDEGFRQSLEADYAEMNSALNVHAWKAVHVLAGSIVEAVLIDYLIEVAEKSGDEKARVDAMKADLAAAITACKDAGILTEKTANLSSVIREYRNLIHPARVIRLRETVDEQGAKVAVALTEMVVAQVGQARGDRLGYTAEQLATKIEGDPATTSLLRQHLLPKLAGSEIEKLMLRVLPDRYAVEVGERGSDSTEARALAEAYRRAYGAIPEAIKRKAAKWFAGIVREQPASIVYLYEDGFFRASQLAFYAQDDAAVVIDHLLARLNAARSDGLLQTTAGIGKWLSPQQLQQAVDITAREVSYGTSMPLDVAARQWLLDLLKEVPPSLLQDAEKRLENWTTQFKNRGDDERVRRVSTLLTGLPASELDDLPF